MAKDLRKYAAERNNDFPEVKFDAETKSGITYHTLQIPEIPNEEEAENFEKFFGSDEISVGVGFGAKTVVLAIGAKPIDTADDVVNGKPAKPPPKTTPPQNQPKGGPGTPTLAYEVPDVGGALADLVAAGAELIDSVPRRGLFGLQVAFVHPDAVHGVLTEVVAVARVT